MEQQSSTASDAPLHDRAEERANTIIEAYTHRLGILRKEKPHAASYKLPLPWYAHENSRELEFIVAHFKPEWHDLRVQRGTGVLELVFVARP